MSVSGMDELIEPSKVGAINAFGAPAAVLGRKADEHLQSGLQGSQAGSGGYRDEPQSKSTRQISRENPRIVPGCTGCLDRHTSMLGIVGDHSAAWQKVIPVHVGKQSSSSPRRKVFIGKPERIADCRAEQRADDR
jgi:hypothetical protein